MDFARDKMERIAGLECGVYEPLDPALLPPLYVAYNDNVSEPTEVIHNNLRERFKQGEPAVVEAMKRLAELTVEARAAILDRDADGLGRSINRNFDLRKSICRLAKTHVQMVESARAAGATASFTGSGGAIVGTYPDEATFHRLRAALETLHCRVIRPRVFPDEG
jgi:glucuronokinase